MKSHEIPQENPFSKAFFEDPEKYAELLQKIISDPSSGISATDVENMLSQPVSACETYAETKREESQKHRQEGVEKVGEKLRLLISSFTGGNQELHNALIVLCDEMDLVLLPGNNDAVASKEEVPSPHFDWVSPEGEEYKIAYHSQAITVYTKSISGNWIQAPLIRE